MIDNELSRRQMLVRTAATAAGLSLSMSLLAAKRARAEINPVPNATADIAVLQALLAAENDAIATYSAGVGIINADTVTPKATKDIVLAVAGHFQSQHQDHAGALKKLITDTGGTPAAASTTPTIPSTFPKAPNTTDVIKLAADKEKAAAFTYAQVMEQISTQTAAKLVASIGAVETQHFIVLYLLAEGFIVPTGTTQAMAAYVVPASFVLDVGLTGTTHLSDNAALTGLLAYDPKPA